MAGVAVRADGTKSVELQRRFTYAVIDNEVGDGMSIRLTSSDGMAYEVAEGESLSVPYGRFGLVGIGADGSEATVPVTANLQPGVNYVAAVQEEDGEEKVVFTYIVPTDGTVALERTDDGVFASSSVEPNTSYSVVMDGDEVGTFEARPNEGLFLESSDGALVRVPVLLKDGCEHWSVTLRRFRCPMIRKAVR